ncbi:MAG: alpha/beta fold hydrolase [Synergistaceae bacterium]|nr:alpha/beta fold hydrolase [Synergistaceae bacterium]
MKKSIVAVMLVLSFAMAASGETLPLKIDGAVGKLSAVIQRPELEAGKKCPIVMLLHGFTGNKSNRPLTDTADLLESAGIASIRFDFNGHGESEGDFVNMTVLNEIEDAKKVYEYVKALDWVESVSVGGHSQGGVVTSMLAGELGAENVKSIVLFAAAAVLRDDAIRGSVMGTTYDAGNPPESVSIFGRFNLGRNYMVSSQTLPIYETAEKYTGPVCLIHGTGDRIVPYTYSERYHKNYVNSEIHLLDGVDHGFTGAEEEAAKIAVLFLKSH